MIEVVLFDFNGVIIDDEHIKFRALHQAFKEHDIEMSEDDYFSRLGMDDVTFVRSMYEQAGREFTDGEVRSVITRGDGLHHAEIEKSLPLFPGAETFIKALSRRYTLGIVSMSRRGAIDYVLERTGLNQRFSGIISADDVTHPKPDPDCYNQAFFLIDGVRREQGHSSLTPTECLVIEDSPPGVRAARAAGMRVLGVTNTVDDAALRAAGAEVVTADLSDWTTDAVHHVFE